MHQTFIACVPSRCLQCDSSAESMCHVTDRCTVVSQESCLQCMSLALRCARQCRQLQMFSARPAWHTQGALLRTATRCSANELRHFHLCGAGGLDQGVWR